MQQSTNLPSISNASTSLPASSPTDLPQSALVSADKMARALARFGPDYQTYVFCRYRSGLPIARAVDDVSPTFYDVTSFFGKEATLFWLRFHLAETFFFLGIYDTASKYQVQQTADLIITHEVYGQLTLSEFLSFLQRFKRGDYGKIYQSSRPNPQELLACLRAFWEDVSYYRGKKEERERLERLERDLHSPDNMTREEYDEIMMLTRMYEMQLSTNKSP